MLCGEVRGEGRGRAPSVGRPPNVKESTECWAAGAPNNRLAEEARGWQHRPVV